MIKCTNCVAEVNYTEAILRDMLSRGLDDPEIQLNLLGDKNQDMTLEQVFQFVEAKEAGKCSASRLLTLHGADALAGSSYRCRRNESIKGRHQNHPSHPKNPNQQETCLYCGKKGHRKSVPPRMRKKECPAYGQACRHSGRNHHFKQVVTEKNEEPAKPDEHEGMELYLCHYPGHFPGQ